jgi:uncharacterized protein (DUF58 family)
VNAPERYVSGRTGWLLAAAALFVVWMPGPWPWVAGIFAALVIVVLLWADRERAVPLEDIEWIREMPAKWSVGEPNSIRVEIGNYGEYPARVVARETPPPGFAGERRPPGHVVVPPFGHVDVEFSFTPAERGLYEFGEVGVRTLGPLGLAGWQGVLPTSEDVRVYPDIRAVRSYALLRRRGALRQIGVRTAKYPGSGTEFESLREYRPGDDYRDMDWKATARRDQPIVRSFEAERSQTLVLAVDAGRLMTPRVGSLTRLDRAVNAALMLAWIATRGDDFVGLLVFGREVQAWLPPRKGARQFRAVLEALYAVKPSLEEPDYDGALKYLAAHLHKRSLVVMFTELAGEEASERLLTTLMAMVTRHLPLVLTQRDRDLEALTTSRPDDEHAVFEAAVAEDLLRDKSAALAMLNARGAMAIDVDPDRLSVAAVDRYLDVKSRGLL